MKEVGYTIASGVKGKEIAAYYRKKGTKFGGHYHTGSDSSKNPELFLLLSGSLSMYARNIKTEEEMNVSVIDPVSTIRIKPFIYHEFTALDDVYFIEYRKTKFQINNSDTLGVTK